MRAMTQANRAISENVNGFVMMDLVVGLKKKKPRTKPTEKQFDLRSSSASVGINEFLLWISIFGFHI